MFKSTLSNIDNVVASVEMPMVSVDPSDGLTTNWVCGMTLSVIVC